MQYKLFLQYKLFFAVFAVAVLAVQVPCVNNAAAAEPKAGELLELKLKGVKWKFHWCPAGTFTRGENNNAHKVTLTQGFYMAETECTQEQWRAITGSNPSKFKGTKLPVEMVNWDDCQEFIKKLNAQNAAPAGFKFALPTAARWEYACRAGSTTTYCFGDSSSQLGDYAWYEMNSGIKTHPVGQKKANAWGLYDMHGNVWERCEDWFEDYPKGDVVDPTGASSGRNRVDCGGSGGSDVLECRSYVRYGNPPDSRGYFLGLRVALVKSSDK